jgi:hypothetical protein
MTGCRKAEQGGLCPAPYVGDEEPVTEMPEAPCKVTVQSHYIAASPHIPLRDKSNFTSNPPTSGGHYEFWAAYKTYSEPVPREYYVHNLEHGGLVLLHNCKADDAKCKEIVRGLESVVNGLPDDPACKNTDVRVRALVTPDPLLDVPIAAVAWGHSYKAECDDIEGLLPSLEKFADDHYGHPASQEECICDDGDDYFYEPVALRVPDEPRALPNSLRATVGRERNS